MAYTEELQRGRPGTVRTLHVMRSLVERGKRDPALVLLSRRIVREVPERDARGELGAIKSWVQDRVRFVRDPVGVEALADPASVIRNGSGDCDEQVIAAATLAECIGYRTRFRVGGDDEDTYRHVWAEALDRSSGTWIALDPIMRGPIGSSASFRSTEAYPLLGDLGMEAVAIGSGRAPFGGPRAFFPRVRKTPRPVIGRSFLELATTSMSMARYASTLDPEEADWSDELSGLGQQAPAGPIAMNDPRIEATVQQWMRRRGTPNYREVPRPNLLEISRLTAIGPAGDPLPAYPSYDYARRRPRVRGRWRQPGDWLAFRYELALEMAGWDFDSGTATWVRSAQQGQIPLPPPLQVPGAPSPQAPLPTTPPPNYGPGPIPFPISPTAQPQQPFYPQPTSPYPQPDYYQQPPPSFEQGRSFVTPTAEFAPFGPEVNMTPTGPVPDETTTPKPAMSPLALAALVAGAVWLFARRGRPTGGA